MPSFWDIRCVVQYDETLNLSTGEVSNGSDTRLPSENAKPALYGVSTSYICQTSSPLTNDIAEKLLIFLGGKFRDPVILTSRSWSHRSHLRH
jgi:hypothetical protein